MIDKVNYHITNLCNYGCKHCFGKFECQKEPTLEQACHVLNQMSDFFQYNHLSVPKINFAGGEPLLYPNLDKVIEYAFSNGLQTSIVTNGSMLTPNRIRAWKGKVSCIGLSIDSVSETTNRSIGRCFKNQCMKESDWLMLAEGIHRNDIKLKINTVVSKWNLHENMTVFYRRMCPDRLKFLQIHRISGINDIADSYVITADEFSDFCNRHHDCCADTVAEPSGSMEDSYLMISPEGKVMLNHVGEYLEYGDCYRESLVQIAKKLPLDANKIAGRYRKAGQS